MSKLTQISTMFARKGPAPYFVTGAVLLVFGAVLQITQVIMLPDLPGLGATPFGIFSKLGGAVILFGLLIAALRSDGSDEGSHQAPHAADSGASRAQS